MHWDSCLTNVCSVETIYTICSKDTTLKSENRLFAKLFSNEETKFWLDWFDSVHQQLYFLEIFPMSFTMKIKPNMFHILPWFFIQKLLKSIWKFCFILHLLFYKIYHYYTIVILSNVVKVTFKHMTAEFFASLDIYFGYKTFLLLFPKERNTASYLYKAEKQIICLDDKFTLHKVGDIWIVINSSSDKSGTCHCMTSPWDQQHLQLMPINIYTILLYVTLNQRNCPKWINVLESKVLNNFRVPEVSFVLKLLSKFEIVVYTWIILEFHSWLSLLTWRQVCMIAEVKSLLGQYLFDSVYIINDLFVHVLITEDILIEWNKFNFSD